MVSRDAFCKSKWKKKQNKINKTHALDGNLKQEVPLQTETQAHP